MSDIQKTYDLIKQYAYPGPYEIVPVGISSRKYYIWDKNGDKLSPTGNAYDPLRFNSLGDAEKFVRHAQLVWLETQAKGRQAMTLRSDLTKLAHQVPELRKRLVPLLRQAGGGVIDPKEARDIKGRAQDLMDEVEDTMRNHPYPQDIEKVRRVTGEAFSAMMNFIRGGRYLPQAENAVSALNTLHTLFRMIKRKYGVDNRDLMAQILFLANKVKNAAYAAGYEV